MMWSRADILAEHVRSGSIYDVRANDKFLCQRSGSQSATTETTATAERCWCFSARARPAARKAAKRMKVAGAPTALQPAKAGGQPTVWTEYVRSGSRSSALSKGGIEECMITPQNVVFSGDKQIKKAQHALEKRQHMSLSRMEEGDRGRVPVEYIERRGKEYGLTRGPDELRGDFLPRVMQAEEAAFAKMQLKGLHPGTIESARLKITVCCRAVHSCVVGTSFQPPAIVMCVLSTRHHQARCMVGFT
jgi:hypothetical protein